MANNETLPQSIADITTVILKPRLDVDAVKLMVEKLKDNLFSRFMFKTKPQETRLIFFETYYEPYLVIGGRYSLDYCKKHTFNVDVDKDLNAVYIAGKEFFSHANDISQTKNLIEITGEEHAHHYKQTFFVLDRMNREIPPEKLPFTPFIYKMEECDLECSFKKLPISTKSQIDFLKSKIALRPSGVAAIIREKFEITDRTIVYNPMYELTFENIKKRKEACILVNGVTGETTIKTFEKQTTHDTSTRENNTHKLNIETYAKSQPTEKAGTFYTDLKSDEEKDDGQKTNPKDDLDKNTVIVENYENEAEENIALGFPAKIRGEFFSVGDNITTIVGDIEITSGSNVNRTLVVKGTLKIGDNCSVKGKLKALKDVTIGADTVIDGDLVSGGNVFVGTRSRINGSIEATGSVQLCKHVIVDRGLHSSSAETTIASEIEVIEDTENVISSVER